MKIMDNMEINIPRLNCETYGDALTSVAVIFGISKSKLENEIKSWQPYGDDSPLSDALIKKLCDKFGNPSKHDAVYFHGTRIGPFSTFDTDGILPKSRAATQLQRATNGLPRGYSDSAESRKDKGAHDGPFGYLIKEMHKQHHYTAIPEFIKDSGGTTLASAYAERTAPCIISFIGEPNDGDLESAIFYLYLKINNAELYREGATYSGEGKPITPARICKITRGQPDQPQLLGIAKNARQAFEKIPQDKFPDGTSLYLSNFPRGCCGDASRILASIIYDQTQQICEYKCGQNREGKSHGWLQLNGFTIDITADQFNTSEENLEPVIVEKNSKWHKGLTIIQSLTNGRHPKELKEAYQIVKSQLI